MSALTVSRNPPRFAFGPGIQPAPRLSITERYINQWKSFFTTEWHRLLSFFRGTAGKQSPSSEFHLMWRLNVKWKSFLAPTIEKLTWLVDGSYPRARNETETNRYNFTAKLKNGAAAEAQRCSGSFVIQMGQICSRQIWCALFCYNAESLNNRSENKNRQI